jgi:tRNA-Thr(GGU) m(6)t(6)A37 methyltransferase TsaA
MDLTLSPIGILHTPFKQCAGVPIQSVYSRDKTGSAEVFPEYRDGLKDLDGFSHIFLIYYFHQSQGFKLQCRPFLDTVTRGLFATRAPRRPNPIGLSLVELVGVRDTVVQFAGPDMVDGTPLLDIKPYIDGFDVRADAKMGWYEEAKNKSQIVADGRFADE